MERNGKLLGYYNYTVILTYIGMLFGFAGILFVMFGNPLTAVMCLMAAGFCDMFDGAIASTKKDRTPSEKCFGIQIDSLSDLICFGVLPAVILSSFGSGAFAVFVSALYVLCALIRLAYFNVDEQERQQTSSGSRERYYGIPVTISALLVPLVYCVSELAGASAYCALALSAALLILAVFFLVPIPLKKPHIAGKIVMLLCGALEVVLAILIA